MKYIITPEGRLLNTGTNAAPVWGWEYDLTDHLGNVRVTFKPNATNNGVVRVEYANYFPFGMKMLSPYSSSSTNKYLYNGKEMQDDFSLNWYDYGARFYDPSIGRWHSLDPMAESGNEFSPYAYCFNNPILMNDPTGMWGNISTTILAATFVDHNNKVIWHNDDGDDNVYMVSDIESWENGGRSKDGLNVIGEEDPKRNYEVGSHYDFYLSPSTLFWTKLILQAKLSLDFWNEFYGGPEGENVTSIDKLQYTTLMVLLSKVKLPTKGTYNYKPPKGWKNNKKLPTAAKGGFIDELGNIWRKPNGNNIQGEFHWDVTLSKKGQQRYNTSRNHLNINQNGEIAH